MSEHLRLNPILCDAYGICAELLPELIELDDWGYPLLEPGPVPPALARRARQAVDLCPRLALSLERRGADGSRPAPRSPSRRLALLRG